MKLSIILIAFLVSFSTPTNADMQTMINSLKSHNDKVMDLKNKPEKYGLAPIGLFQIKYAALHLEIATMQLFCNSNNRKVCSNQLATNEVK
jgi:hypothetical protein